MDHDVLVALPEIIGQFNGFYTRFGMFVMVDQSRVLGTIGLALAILLVGVAWGIRHLIISRRQDSA
jgi:hypothetical protein